MLVSDIPMHNKRIYHITFLNDTKLCLPEKHHYSTCKIWLKIKMDTPCTRWGIPGSYNQQKMGLLRSYAFMLSITFVYITSISKFERKLHSLFKVLN